MKNIEHTTKLVLGAIYTALAAIFQSAGIFTGVGYALSILATLPIVLATQMSIRIGILSYLLTIMLLWILQPSELFVFPFTTGLLGLALGIALLRSKGWIAPVICGSAALTAGILLLLYIIRFPVLGQSISNSFNFITVFIILLFSFFYSLIWVGLIKKITVHLQKIIKKSERQPE